MFTSDIFSGIESFAPKNMIFDVGLFQVAFWTFFGILKGTKMFCLVNIIFVSMSIFEPNWRYIQQSNAQILNRTENVCNKFKRSNFEPDRRFMQQTVKFWTWRKIYATKQRWILNLTKDICNKPTLKFWTERKMYATNKPTLKFWIERKMFATNKRSNF